MDFRGMLADLLSKPDPALDRKIVLLFEDAVDAPHPVAAALKSSRESLAVKRGYICGNLSVDLAKWRNGSARPDKSTKNPIRWEAKKENERLLALLRGDPMLRTHNPRARKENLEFARALPAWWRRPGATHRLDDIIGALSAHDDVLAADIRRFEAGQIKADDQAVSALAATYYSHPAPVPLAAGSQPHETRRFEDREMAAGAAASETESPAQALSAVSETLRHSALPLGGRRPRPVNLLMALGVSRHSALAVVVGADPAKLAGQLAAVEMMVRRASSLPLGEREWSLSLPEVWTESHSPGVILPMPSRVPAVQIWRAMAATLERPGARCGGMLVLALPAEMGDWADQLVEICRAARDASRSEQVRQTPIYLWTSITRDVDLVEPLLGRIRSCLNEGRCDDAATDVQTVFRMSGVSAGLSPEWTKADGEQMRLHDLSLATGAEANRPGPVEVARALDLVALAEKNRNLLYGLAFLPVDATILGALSKAPPLTRAVVWLASPQELSASRPPWAETVAQGYRPRAAAPSAALAGIET
jgi:hypothetical protein